MVNDNANPDIISRTQANNLNLVRLYFRPRTPTQYRNEGIKRKSKRDDGHCPVPVFFLFDLVSMLQREDVSFSPGPLASPRYSANRTVARFKTIPFDKVYHDEGLGYLYSDYKEEVKKARHAEIVVPQRLKLGNELRFVYCRSQAERSTLLHGIRPNIYSQWVDKVGVRADGMYYGLQHYVNNVTPVDSCTVAVELNKKPLNFGLETTFIFRSGPQKLDSGLEVISA